MVLTLFSEEYPMLCYIVGSDGRLLHILRSMRRPKKCVYWEHQRGINPARHRVPELVGCGDNGRHWLGRMSGRELGRGERECVCAAVERRAQGGMCVVCMYLIISQSGPFDNKGWIIRSSTRCFPCD